jgi:hypothetical protein
MALLLTTIFSLALWIVLLSLGVKPFDSLLLAVLLILLAASVRVFRPFLAGDRGGDGPSDNFTPR